MLTGKVLLRPCGRRPRLTSYHGGFRRYFGGDGTSYAGVTYSHGFSREIRAAVDLTTLDSDTVRGEFDVLSGRRLRIFGTAATSRGERANRPVVWQTTLTAGVSVQF